MPGQKHLLERAPPTGFHRLPHLPRPLPLYSSSRSQALAESMMTLEAARRLTSRIQRRELT